jgi:hypothetical protein
MALGLNQPLTEISKCKGKAVPLQAWSGPEGSSKLRFPDFLTTAQDGCKIVNPTHRPHLPPYPPIIISFETVSSEQLAYLLNKDKISVQIDIEGTLLYTDIFYVWFCLELWYSPTQNQ